MTSRIDSQSPMAHPNRLQVRKAHPVCSVRRERGVGLIEVLLAVVIISVGFLATARMQIEGMSASQNSYSLSQARFMVLDMAERMRANRVALSNGLYDGMETAAGVSAPACLESTTPCFPADRVAADRFAWSQLLHPSNNGVVPILPSSDTVTAQGTVELVNGAYIVTATWAERAEGNNGPGARSFSIRVVP